MIARDVAAEIWNAILCCYLCCGP